MVRLFAFAGLIALLLCCQTHNVFAAEGKGEEAGEEEPLLLSAGDTQEGEEENRGEYYLAKNCEEKVFEAEEEWKEICKDQHIPPVRPVSAFEVKFLLLPVIWMVHMCA